MLLLGLIVVRTGEYRDHVVLAYFEKNHSVIATQMAFRLHLCIPRNETVFHLLC